MTAVFVKEVGAEGEGGGVGGRSETEADGGVRDVVNPGRTGWGSRPDIGVGEVAKVKIVTWGKDVGAEGGYDPSRLAFFQWFGDGCRVDLARRVEGKKQ